MFGRAASYNRRVSRRFAALLALLLVCLGCGPGERRAGVPPAPAAAADDARPQEGGTLVRRMDSEITTLNPVAVATGNDRLVVDYLFTPLLYLDQELQPIPGLADSWDVLEGGRLYRFRLNPKATFSDGTPVRARDVLFTLNKIVDPASEAVQIAEVFEHLDVTRTRATSDHTIEIAFRQPLASQLLRFADLLVVPEHVYSKGKFRDDYNDTAVGSGPYRLVRSDRTREIVVARREDYWGARPPLQTVVFKIIGDQVTAWNALRRGDVDESRVSSDVWLRERSNPQLTRDIDFLRFYTLSYNFITWNTRNPKLSDKRVRRALAMCIPIDTVINELYHGTARAMSGPFTPEDFAYNPGVPVVRHDPAGARALLAGAGWRDSNGDGVLDRNGQPLRIELLTMAGSATTLQFAQMVQGEMKKIGVDLELSTIEFAAGIERLLARNYEAAYLGFELDNDPDPFNILHSSRFPPRGQNYALYSNREVDRLIEQARVELDRSRRNDLYWKLHALIAEEQPYTWTLQVSSKWGIRKRVRGVELSRGYGLFRWYPGPFSWWIPRELRTHDRAAP